MGSNFLCCYANKRFLLPLAGVCCPESGRGRLPAASFFAFFLSFLFLPFADGFSPASGRGRLRGGRQGVRGASPSTPPTTPVLPLVRVAEGVAVACRVPCPPLAAGAIGAHLPASRAICAPAAALPLRGDRLRAPARWAGGIFFGFRVERGNEVLFSLCKEAMGIISF